MYEYEQFSAHVRRTVYFFFRTTRALPNANDALDTLQKAFPDGLRMMRLGSDIVTWENGLVFQCHTARCAIDIGQPRERHLDRFDGWALHDGETFYENPQGGPLSRFFARKEAARFSQLFLLGHEGRRPDRVVEEVRGAMRSTVVPAFHFANGTILFLESAEPATITRQRCQYALAKLAGWAIIDGNGEQCSSRTQEHHLWRRDDLTYLRFGADDDEAA